MIWIGEDMEPARRTVNTAYRLSLEKAFTQMMELQEGYLVKLSSPFA